MVAVPLVSAAARRRVTAAALLGAGAVRRHDLDRRPAAPLRRAAALASGPRARLTAARVYEQARRRGRRPRAHGPPGPSPFDGAARRQHAALRRLGLRARRATATCSPTRTSSTARPPFRSRSPTGSTRRRARGRQGRGHRPRGAARQPRRASTCTRWSSATPSPSASATRSSRSATRGLERTLGDRHASRAASRSSRRPSGYVIDGVFETDAVIDPANSGGPLLDADGRVIGITSRMRTARSARARSTSPSRSTPPVR